MCRAAEGYSRFQVLFRQWNDAWPAGLAAIAGKDDGAIGNADIGGGFPRGAMNRCVFENQVHHVPPWP